MNITRKLLSGFLSAAVIVSSMPMSGIVLAEEEKIYTPFETVDIYSKIMAYQEQYPEGSEWTPETEYKNISDSRAFAGMLTENLFVTDEFELTRYSTYIKSRGVDHIGPGDTVIVDQHYSVVLEALEDSVIVVELGTDSKVTWNREISFDELQNGGLMTSYTEEEYNIPTTKVTLEPGEEYKPDIYAPRPLSLHWESSSPEVASVDENGNITALSCGQAMITAASETYSMFIIITVPDHEKLDNVDPNIMYEDSHFHKMTDEDGYMRYYVNDWTYMMMYLHPQNGDVWFRSTNNPTDLTAVLLENGYAESFDPSEVIDGAMAFPLDELESNDEFVSSTGWNYADFPQLSEYDAENIFIVSGAVIDRNKLWEMDGVANVYSVSAVYSEKAWVDKPSVAVCVSHSYMQQLTTDNLAANGITGVASIEPYASYISVTNKNSQAFRLTFDDLPEDTASPEYISAVLEKCTQINEALTNVSSYPLFAHSDAFPEVPEQYNVQEVPYYSLYLDENGTIINKSSYDTWDFMWNYADGDVYQRKEYDNNFIAAVTPTDAEAFLAEFEGKYHIERSYGETQYRVAPLTCTDLFGSASGWYLEEAEEAARLLVQSENVASVDVCEGSWEFELVWIHDDGFSFSSAEVITEDILWALDDNADSWSVADVELNENGRAGRVTLAPAENTSEYSTIRAALLRVIETIPSIYNVGIGYSQNDLAVSNSFEVLYTLYHEDIVTGDPDGSGEVDLDDAVDVLGFYAENAAGIENAAIRPAAAADENEYSARASEMSARAAADVNRDGRLNLDDAVCILSYYANKAAGNPVDWK